MTLADNILLSTRTLTYFVRIYTTVGTYSGPNVLLLPNNPTLATGTPGVSGIRISKSFDSPVPVCQLDLNRVPSWITRGMGVTVDVGYNGLTNRLFTGFIQSRERGIGKGSVNCMGRLWTAFRTVQIGSRSVDGVTVSSAIGTILDYVGITDNRSLTVPAFTLGTASSPVLERMPASQMLQMLMDIDGCRIYELGSGQVVVKVIDEAPAATSFKTYTSNNNANARVLEASDREDPEYYRNRVIVTGATVTEGSAPDETSRTITATATNTGSALVQPALPSGTYVDAEYNNHLIDTDAKAAAVAIRLLAKFARIPRQLQLEIAGDPELELGQTLTFTMPELDLNDRGFISGIEHIIDESGYVTRLTDFRGAGDTGGTLSQNPIAAFTFKSEVEMYGAQTNTVATLDASSSFDPDGTIASYAWSDNQTTTPEISTFTGKFARVRADTSAWTGSWSVTLTVTDNDGLTGSTTITIPYKNTDAEIVIPAIYAAINNNASASLDGAVTWKDASHSTTISVGARPADGVNVGYACFGDSTGHIYRTTDGCTTITLVYTSAAGVAINDVRWDWRNGNVVWAIDENCIVYISVDAGATWTIYASLRTTLSLAGALGNQIGLPAAGGIYIFGGTGAGSPLIAYDPVVGSQAWVKVAFTGDLLTDTVTTPADATMRIIDYTAGFSQECMILSWASGGGASITAVYTTPAGGASSRAFTRASTTFGGLKSGRYIVSDNVLILSNAFYCAFANRSIWSSTDGVAWTETTNVMPVGVTPNHAIGMTGSTELTGIVGMFGVFMIAASDGIYKWTVGEATASYIRGGTGGGTAWPASAVGKKLAIGASGAASSAGSGKLAVLTTSASPRTITKLANTIWSALVSVTGITVSLPRLFVQDSAHYYALSNDQTQGGALSGNMSYSLDSGATWTAGLAKVVHVAWDAGGRLWLLARESANTYRIYYSDDYGATTTSSFNPATTSNSFFVACHPTNNQIIAVWVTDASAHPRFITTANRGSSWTTTNPSAPRPDTFVDGVQYSYGFVILPSGRYVVSGYFTTGTKGNIMTSDDSGATWTTRQTDAATAYLRYGLGANGGTKVVTIINASNSAYPWVSNDSGTTWAALALSQNLQTFTGNATITIKWMVYDAANDALYVNTNDSAFPVVKLTPVTDAGVWSNMKYNIPSTALVNSGMAVIP